MQKISLKIKYIKSFTIQIRKVFLFMCGDGAQSALTISICENNRKGKKIKHCVDPFFLSRGCEDRDIFSRIYLSICNGHIRPPPPS